MRITPGLVAMAKEYRKQTTLPEILAALPWSALSEERKMELYEKCYRLNLAHGGMLSSQATTEQTPAEAHLAGEG